MGQLLYEHNGKIIIFRAKINCKHKIYRAETNDYFHYQSIFFTNQSFGSARTLEPVKGEMNNVNHLITMHVLLGNSVLAFMWVLL